MARSARPRWLVLIWSAPHADASLRVKVWRKLKAMGASSLRNSAYLLPYSEERLEIAQWLCQEVLRAGGEAILFAVDRIQNLAGAEAGRKGAAAAKPLRPGDFRGRTWVTRPRPHVDRIATAWAIRRFLDPHARFAFAREPGDIRGAIPFDYMGVEFGHYGEDCTLETFARRFRLRDPALREVARIVHDVDLKDAKFGRPEAPGLDAVLRGLVMQEPDDRALLKRGFPVFEALYEGFARGRRVKR